MDFYDRNERFMREERERFAAQEAAERAAHAELVAPFPKWEYKVLTNSALAGWFDGNISRLEDLLNAYAADGWRVITMSFTGQISEFLAPDKNNLYVVLERPAIGGGHSGHPVTAIAS